MEWGGKVLELETELLQQQQEERQDLQRQPAGDVGGEQQKLPGGEIAEGDGAGMDPSSKPRRAPSKQPTRQVELPLGLEMVGAAE
jgi:hypothetical protein